MTKVNRMEVQEPWLSMIESGAKTVEGRSGPRSKFTHLIGNAVELYYKDQTVHRQVVDVRHYDALDEYLEHEWRLAAPTARSVEEARQMYLEIRTSTGEQVYSAERLERHGRMPEATGKMLPAPSLPAILSGGEGEDQAVQPMDVLLDTCWAVLAEIEQLAGSTALSSHLQEFRQQYGDLIGRIGIARDANEKYETIEKIGKGAYGNVYLVKERVTGRHFAMKTISKARVFRQPDNARFMEERRIMSSRDSAWLTRLEESFQDELFLYMVMEYMPGGDLGSLDPEQEGIPEEQAKFYAAELVLALDELHRMGYVHRDVKPGNVMIREDGHVRLADFGSAGRLDPKTGLVFSRSSVGTPDYIAPEALEAQQSRNGACYGAECDWWGLGVTLYELLTGTPPFFAPSLVQTYRMIANHEEHLTLDDPRISEAAKSLLRGLMCDKKSRLDLEGIKSHPFFEGIAWDELQMAVPPFIPILESPEDTSRFYLDDDDDGEASVADLQIVKKKGLAGFEGVQFPFIGYTFDSMRTYKVAWDALPVLQRMESCQIRLGELESQLTEMRQSCETAKLVNEQIKRIASCDELALAQVASDDLQAAYDALMQNYDFLQMHYEELLREHDRTSRQLEALLTTLQEQETARATLENELTAQQKKAALDKLKIGELVKKLASMAMPCKTSTESQSTLSLSDVKKQLKRLQQDYKCLEQQLDKETRSRLCAEEELAELKMSKATLEQEHESLLVELRSGALPPKLERKSSDVGSILRSLVKGHSRQPSTSSMQNCSLGLDGPVKILEPKLSRRRELQWNKSHLAIRETGLWLGDREASMCLLGTLKADVFWAQPVQPGELLGLATSKSRKCFKIRFLLAAPPTEELSDLPSTVDVTERLEKEQKILRGAQQLLDAARTPEQKAIAQSHVDASQRLITDLQQQRDTTSSIGHIQHTWVPTSIDDPVCDGCLFPGATLRCPACDAHSHQHCHAILPISCQQAALLMQVQPTYVQVTSADDVRKWIRAMETARRLKL